MKTNGSGQWILFHQLGDDFLWDAATVDVNASAGTGAAQTATLTVPTGVQVVATFSVQGGAGTGKDGRYFVSSFDKIDEFPTGATNVGSNGYYYAFN